eukprot:SAG31_NODE_1635_length_7682_cov_5.457471_4_plen_40_part_00
MIPSHPLATQPEPCRMTGMICQMGDREINWGDIQLVGGS